MESQCIYFFHVQTIMKRKTEILDDYDGTYFFVMLSLTQ